MRHFCWKQRYGVSTALFEAWWKKGVEAVRQLQNGFPFRFFLFWFLEIIQKWPAHISSPIAPVSPWHYEFEECWWLWCWLVCATSTTPLCFHILEAGTSDLHSEAEELFRRFFVYRNSHVPTQKEGAAGWICLYLDSSMFDHNQILENQIFDHKNQTIRHPSNQRMSFFDVQIPGVFSNETFRKTKAWNDPNLRNLSDEVPFRCWFL